MWNRQLAITGTKWSKLYWQRERERESKTKEVTWVFNKQTYNKIEGDSETATKFEYRGNWSAILTIATMSDFDY